MEMVEESEVQSRATQQLINVFRDSVAKQQELAHMLMGVWKHKCSLGGFGN